MITGQNVDMTKGNIPKVLFTFAVPILISNIFQQLYNTIDTLIVGNYLGDTSLAAMGACSAVYDLLIGFAMGVGTGLSVVVARSYGAKREGLLQKTVAGAIIIGALLTLVIMLLSRIGLYPLLRLLDTPANIIEESYSYLSTITLFVSVMFAYNLCAGLLRAIGNSFMPLLFLILSSIINVSLDLLFIVGFHMGIQGAAAATVIAQGIAFLLCALYIACKKPILIPQKESFRFDRRLYGELAGQGFSMGVMMMIVSTGTVILQRAINGFGYLTIAAHTTARRINAFSIMPCGTVSAALSTFVSQNRGANQRERIKKGIYTGIFLVLAWGAVSTLLMLLFSRRLIAGLSGSREAVILTNGSRYLMINAPFYAVAGILFILRHALQGLGEKVIPIASSLIELTGKALFAWLLIPRLGYWAVIICEPIIWCMMCAVLFIAFLRNPYLKEGTRDTARPTAGL